METHNTILCLHIYLLARSLKRGPYTHLSTQSDGTTDTEHWSSSSPLRICSFWIISSYSSMLSPLRSAPSHNRSVYFSALIISHLFVIIIVILCSLFPLCLRRNYTAIQSCVHKPCLFSSQCPRFGWRRIPVYLSHGNYLKGIMFNVRYTFIKLQHLSVPGVYYF